MNRLRCRIGCLGVCLRRICAGLGTIGARGRLVVSLRVSNDLPRVSRICTHKAVERPLRDDDIGNLQVCQSRNVIGLPAFKHACHDSLAVGKLLGKTGRIDERIRGLGPGENGAPGKTRIDIIELHRASRINERIALCGVDGVDARSCDGSSSIARSLIGKGGRSVRQRSATSTKGRAGQGRDKKTHAQRSLKADHDGLLTYGMGAACAASADRAHSGSSSVYRAGTSPCAGGQINAKRSATYL